jgi:hypothetical protein
LRFKIVGYVLLLIIFILGSIFGYYVIRSKYIKSFGITLTPSRDFSIHKTTQYLQNDTLWSSDNIGNTSLTMGGAGCLITCVAVSLSDIGIAITPQELNKKLTDIDGYIKGELIWYKINNIFPSVNYSYKRVFSSRTIENDLSNNMLPIVNVRFNGNGVTHWVIIVGAKDGNFLIFDPFDPFIKNETPISLNTHGKVYAYRVLRKIND